VKSVMELREAGWRALVAALGLPDAIRYRVLFEQATGDYRREREEIFRGASIESLCEALERREREGADPSVPR